MKRPIIGIIGQPSGWNDSNPFTNNSNLNSSTNLVKEEYKNEENKPIINVDSESKVIDDNVISDDEFFDDFFSDDE